MDTNLLHMKIGVALLIIIAISFCAVQWVYFKILRIAKAKNIVDTPDVRKLQKTPVPVMGGIAVFFGVLVGVFASSAIPLQFHIHSYLYPPLCAMAVMLYVGALDDIIGLTPGSRLIIEILTIAALMCASNGCIDTLHGLWGIENFSWWIGIPLTIIAGVGIINAVNMIDGVNGLSSGLCILWSTSFGIFFVHSNDMQNAYIAFAMAASLLPFFIHNVFGQGSRMFIGDAGTMLMGVLMTWFVMCLLKDDTRLIYYSGASGVDLIALALAIMSVPVFDTLRVMTLRIIKGKSPLKADKTHLHHIFINIGVGHIFTAGTEILINLIIIVIWIIAEQCRLSYDMQLYVVIISSVILVWGTYGFLSYHINHHTAFLHKLTHFSVFTDFRHYTWYKRLSAYLDTPEHDESTKEEEAARQEHLTMKYEHLNPCEQSRLKIMNFIKGRVEVHVKDIRRRSGAEEEYIDQILKDAIDEERIVVIKKDKQGNPEIIALV